MREWWGKPTLAVSVLGRNEDGRKRQPVSLAIGLGRFYGLRHGGKPWVADVGALALRLRTVAAIVASAHTEIAPQVARHEL